MFSLFSDRFLNKFVGEIRRKQMHPTSITDGQNPDADEDEVADLNKNVAVEIREKDAPNSQETRQGSTPNTSEVDNG